MAALSTETTLGGELTSPLLSSHRHRVPADQCTCCGCTVYALRMLWQGLASAPVPNWDG